GRPPFDRSGEEAPPGFEPGIEDLQSSALPLGHGAEIRRERPAQAAAPFASRAGNRTRTGDPNLGKVVLYQLSYSRDDPALLADGKLGRAPISVNRPDAVSGPVSAEGI